MDNPQKEEYPWYKDISSVSPIEQGDFFYKLPLFVPTTKIVESSTVVEKGTVQSQVVESITANCIVMTHSCDFQEQTTDDFNVLMCPIFELSKDPKKINNYLSKEKWGIGANDRSPDYRIINKYDSTEPGLSFFYQYVDLTKAYSIPYGVLKAHSLKQGSRVRLLPPYREHLAQAFAHRFMRIGLPTGLPRKRPYEDELEQ